MSRLAGELAEGGSLSRALAATQQRLIGEGVPAAAWAGFVVLGDGDLVPVPGGRAAQPRTAWRLALALLSLVVLGLGPRHLGRGRVGRRAASPTS